MSVQSPQSRKLGQYTWRFVDKATSVVRGRRLGSRFPILFRIHAKIRHSLGATRTRVLGHDFEVDPGDTLKIAAFGFYEPIETAWYQENVHAGDTVLEVGANIGFFTLLFAKLVGNEGLVYAYEPDPEIGSILERNVARNGYSNVTVRHVAAGSTPGRMTLHYSAKNRGDNRFFAADGDTATVDIDVCALDDELTGLDRRIDLMKMDIQGAEPLALAGMSSLLASAPPRKILMEFWPCGLTALGNEPRELLERLTGLGYRISELGVDGEKPVDISELAIRYTPESQLWVNLVCEHERP